MSPRLSWALAALTSILAAPSPCAAYEGQTALLGSGGVEQWRESGAFWAPVLRLEARRGLSDWFDLRGAMSTARYSFCPGGVECDDQTWHWAALSALSAKIDIIEWVPYAGPQLGLHGLFGGPIPQGASEFDLSLGGIMGLDYSPTRSLGVGIEADGGLFLAGVPERFAQAGYWSLVAHLEYRWGW